MNDDEMGNKNNKSKRKYIIDISVIILLAVAFFAWQANLYWRITGKSLHCDKINESGIGLAYNAEPNPEIADYCKHNYAALNDLRWYDCNNLSEEEKENIKETIPRISFNEDTIFTKDIEDVLQPDAILEQGKNPGLNVRTLHEQGITGKNVGIAIIDFALYTKHPEYASRLKSCEGIHVVEGETASMHGVAVCSIAVGQNCGVAPEADLYYWACSGTVNYNDKNFSEKDIDWESYARIIDRIIEVNETLPDDSKIRVISISKGYEFSANLMTNMRIRKVLEAIKRADEAGIFVVTVSTGRNYDFISSNNCAFLGLGKIDPAGNPDDISNYKFGNFLRAEDAAYYKDMLFVPMDFRTTADMAGDTYALYADGGLSWTCPYVAGLYALCAQVDPDITPESFYTNAMETATVVERTADAGEAYTFRVVNPQKLVERFMKN